MNERKTKKKSEHREVLRLMRWAQDGYPPINWNDITVDVLDLIKEIKRLRTIIPDEVIKSINLYPCPESLIKREQDAVIAMGRTKQSNAIEETLFPGTYSKTVGIEFKKSWFDELNNTFVSEPVSFEEAMALHKKGITIVNAFKNIFIAKSKTKFGRHPSEPNNSPFITPNHYKILVRKVKKMVDEMESKISNDFEPIPAEIDDIAYLLHKMSKMVIVKGIFD